MLLITHPYAVSMLRLQTGSVHAHPSHFHSVPVGGANNTQQSSDLCGCCLLRPRSGAWLRIAAAHQLVRFCLGAERRSAPACFLTYIAFSVLALALAWPVQQ